MKQIRAYYKPDIRTSDWPIYFYPKENEHGFFKWVMDIDNEFIYDFEFPFIDDDWVIQKSEGEEWIDVL